MKIEDSILDFLDGNLSSHDEEELLHRLAVSPERRAVLKQHLQVRELSSALARKHNYVVPKAVTAQLFHSLATNGYAGPMFHTSADHAAALEQSLMQNLNKAAETVVARRGFSSRFLTVSSVLSFIVGAFLMYFLTPSIMATESTPTMAARAIPASAQVGIDTHSSKEVNSGQISSGSERVSTTNVDQSANKNDRTDNYARSANVVKSTTVISASSHSSRSDFSTTIDAENLSFASRRTNIDLSTSSVPFDQYEAEAGMRNTKLPAVNVKGVSIVENNFSSNQNVANSSDLRPITSELTNITSRNWYDGKGILVADLINEHSLKGHFRKDVNPEDPSSILEHTTASLRSGGGQAPGNSQKISGSLIEMKFSADLTSWLVAKVSFGQFMPYETEAINKGLNADGVRQLKLEPILQYKSIVGAEIGVRFNVLGAPIEVMGGFASDMKESFMPRASIFSNLMLQDNLSLLIGAEAILYQHDIRPSLTDQQNLFAADHPVLISTMKAKELSGFIGPAIELAWHF